MTENRVHGQSADPGLRGALVFFCLLLALGFWAVTSDWPARGQLKGVGREAQTLVSAQFIQQENDFSPAYPTPVLGRPWSIPVEFPLYQWTAVVVSNLTGLELAGTGRAVGLLCFYLALPALFLVLRDSGLTPDAGLVVLGAVAGNIFCLDQAAAFQGESMALMFAAWFLAGMVRALATGRRGWFWLAILAGGAAGIIHGRTLLVFHLLALGWSGGWFWRNRGATPARAARAWWLAAGLLPWAAVGGWMHYAAGIRQLNANASHLSAIGMERPGFAWAGFSTDLAGRQLSLIGTQVVWWPLLLAGAALAVTFSERWWRQMAVCTGCFLVARLLFPVVREPHLHEMMAGTVCLLVALGFVLAGLFDPALPRWAGPAGLLLFCAGQFHQVRQPIQSEPPISQLGQAIQQSVPREAYLVTLPVAGTGLRLPLATRRRTLNLVPEQAASEAGLRTALAALGKEAPGAIVLSGDVSVSADLVARIAALTGSEFQRVFTCQEWTVYLPKAGLRRALDQLMVAGLPEVVLAPEALPKPEPLAGEWKQLDKMWAFQRTVFQGMQPAPVSFYSTFGPDFTGDGAELWYNAHPVTRLRFRLPPGPHRLQTRVMIQPAAFDPALPPGEITDGVEFQLAAVGPDDERHVLHTRLIDPAHNAADRQPQAVDLRFTLPPGTELEIFFGPGPAGRINHDWVYLGRLRLE